MAKNAARLFTDYSNAGVPIQSGPQTGVRINGIPVAVKDSVLACHNHGDTEICQSPFSIGSPTVRAGGKSILRLNDSAQCGHKIITGSPNVRVA